MFVSHDILVDWEVASDWSGLVVVLDELKLRRYLLCCNLCEVIDTLFTKRDLLLPAVVKHAVQHDSDGDADDERANNGGDGHVVEEAFAFVESAEKLWVLV